MYRIPLKEQRAVIAWSLSKEIVQASPPAQSVADPIEVSYKIFPEAEKTRSLWIQTRFDPADDMDENEEDAVSQYPREDPVVKIT